MNSLDKWIKAVKKLSIFPHSRVACPECDNHDLMVFDTIVHGEQDEFERVLYCPACKIYNSLAIENIGKMMCPQLELSEEYDKVITQIKKEKKFAADASKQLD